MKKLILLLTLTLALLLLTGCGCKHEHTALQGVIEPACVTAGYTGDTVCLDCEKTLTQGEAIPMTGHQYEDDESQAPTCMDFGFQASIHCTICRELKQEYMILSPLGHDVPERTGAVEATCAANGYEGDGVCARCGSYARGRVIPSLPHACVDHICTICGQEEPGLYSYETHELLMSWDELVDTYKISYSPGLTESRITHISSALADILVLPAGAVTDLYEMQIERYNSGDPINLRGIYFPSGTQKIEKYAMWRSETVEFVVVAGPVTSIPHSAFADNPNLKQVTLPDTVTELTGYTFYKDTALEQLRLPASLTKIGSNCFADCTSLKRVAFNSVIVPARNVFLDCPLQELVLPAEATENMLNALNYRTVTQVFFRGSQTQWEAINGGSYFNNAVVTFDYAGE